MCLWEPALENTCSLAGKDAAKSLRIPMPGTRADTFVRQLILGSITPMLQLSVKDQPSSHHVHQYICMKYTGGFNWEQNSIWKRELETKKMEPGEKIDQFVARKELLISCLKENGQLISPYTLPEVCFSNLPPQFAAHVDQLILNHGLASSQHIVMMLRRTAE